MVDDSSSRCDSHRSQTSLNSAKKVVAPLNKMIGCECLLTLVSYAAEVHRSEYAGLGSLKYYSTLFEKYDIQGLQQVIRWSLE